MASHEELIKAGSFSEKFKNTLRDYYNYGFKNYEDLQKINEKGKLYPVQKTIDDDWTRLNNILYGYFEWSDNKKEIIFASADSAAMKENPFQKVYRFCGHNKNDPKAFFNIVFALSKIVELEGLEESNESLERILDIDMLAEVEKRDRWRYINFVEVNSDIKIEERNGDEICCDDIIPDDEKLEKYLQKNKRKNNTNSICLVGEKSKQKKVLPVSRRDEIYVIKLVRCIRFINEHPNSIAKDWETTHYLSLTNETDANNRVDITGMDFDLIQCLISDKGGLYTYKNEFREKMCNEFQRRIEELYERIIQKEPLLAAQLQCFYPSDVALFDKDNNAINNKLEELCGLGILEKNGLEQSGYSWSLKELCLERILCLGKTLNEEFEQNFVNAIEFFSEYALLGEIGKYILERMHRTKSNVFRFKHEYFMQSLNDFILIDLLDVIEKKSWCKIKYRYAISSKETEVICRPLEIRVSSVNGREYLSFYEPFVRSYSNLRLEYIESVECIEKIVDNEARRTIDLAEQNVQDDIRNVEYLLQHSWGVSTIEERIGNAVNMVPLHEVNLKIAFDPLKEQYIVNRLCREKRSGNVRVMGNYIEYNIRVTDHREMLTWIRSYYSRILECTGLEINGSPLIKDVQKIKKSLERDKLRKPWKNPGSEDRIWGVPKNVSCHVMKENQHDFLFHEVHSVYYSVFAETLMYFFSQTGKVSFTEDEISGIVNKELLENKSKYGLKTEKNLRKELKELLLSNGFLRKGYKGNITDMDILYKRKYQVFGKSFFKDILPLTKLEVRWLLTILDDEKMEYFLEKEEIEAIKEELLDGENEVKKLPIEKIFYFDRYEIRENSFYVKGKNNEKLFLQEVVKAIQGRNMISLKYESAQGKSKEGQFMPIIIEYSKRDDLFRGYFWSADEELMYIMNLARIEMLSILNKQTFDYTEAQKRLEEYRKRNKKEIRIEFYDINNMADRILSEFAPWEKRCIYDRESKLYQLKIIYQKQDEMEMVVRLLGYGANIRILDKESSIYKEISKRIDKQLELMKEQAKETKETETKELELI